MEGLEAFDARVQAMLPGQTFDERRCTPTPTRAAVARDAPTNGRRVSKSACALGIVLALAGAYALFRHARRTRSDWSPPDADSEDALFQPF
jgi:hypothetical protein